MDIGRRGQLYSKGAQTERSVAESCGLKSCLQNSRYEPELARGIGAGPSVPVAGSSASEAVVCRFSHAASVKVGCAPTTSRIICHAAKLSAPSGAGPMASETAHCGQKQIRRADDFCRGRTPVVWANRNTATDFSPVSSSRLQRRQNGFSKRFHPRQALGLHE